MYAIECILYQKESKVVENKKLEYIFSAFMKEIPNPFEWQIRLKRRVNLWSSISHLESPQVSGFSLVFQDLFWKGRKKYTLIDYRIIMNIEKRYFPIREIWPFLQTLFGLRLPMKIIESDIEHFPSALRTCVSDNFLI